MFVYKTFNYVESLISKQFLNGNTFLNTSTFCVAVINPLAKRTIFFAKTCLKLTINF